MLEVQNVSAAYHDTLVLESIDLQVKKGEYVGIIGPNGAGKTTLLKVMTGIKSPLDGKVVLEGKDLKHLSRKQIARTMAVVPQSSFVPPLFTVEEVVSMGRYARQKSRFTVGPEDKATVEQAMRKTGIAAFRFRMVNQLSGGERQAVIIARALAQEPSLLMLDEPTASLDIKHQIKLLALVRSLVEAEGVTAIMVIHDLNLAARFCSRLILLHRGGISAQGTPERVLTPENLRSAYEVDACINYNPVVDAVEVTAIDSIHRFDHMAN